MVYDLVPAESEIVILVYRAGPFAKLGHNHAVASTDESGRAWIGDSLQHSGFEVRVPVAQLTVDDPAVRAAAGEDFPGTVPDEARDGTRRNMLRPEVLDATRFPEIVVRSVSIEGSFEQARVLAAVTLRDVTREIEAPVLMQRSDSRIAASGSFRLRQSDFGITPFSVAGGAVQVGDEIEVRFRIVAARNAG